MSGKIIVIDDEPLILTTIERALARVGYSVTTTGNPSTFLKKLSSDGADLMIVDLHLGGVDTSGLIEQAREVSPTSKVLVVSGSSRKETQENYLQKPFKIVDLRELVRDLIGSD